MSSIISNDNNLLNKSIEKLSENFGVLDYISKFISFDYTDYYSKEMGSPLVRRFISFEKLIKPEALPEVKLVTNTLELDHSEKKRRRVNIDPGYISLANLILGTGKGFAHRPYLGLGIYADLTLIYKNQSFQPLEWTYPDYSDGTMIKMLNKIRGRYLMQLLQLKDGEKT